jgi:hypothetical protein
MAKFHFTVITENKYPIETKGNIEISGWRAAAGKAVKIHLDDLKATRKGQRVGDKMTIKLLKLPKDVVDSPPESAKENES